MIYFRIFETTFSFQMTVTVPKFLLFIDITWVILWFIIICWFEASYPALDTYRLQLRLIYRHIICSLALFYVISHGKKPLPLLAVLPFIYALLDDILNVLNLSNRITPIEDQVAYNFTAALTSIALIVSGLATIWFVIHYFQENERGKNRTNGRSLEIP